MHTYGQPGSYTVTLQADGVGIGSDEPKLPLTVHVEPLAAGAPCDVDGAVRARLRLLVRAGKRLRVGVRARHLLDVMRGRRLRRRRGLRGAGARSSRRRRHGGPRAVLHRRLPERRRRVRSGLRLPDDRRGRTGGRDGLGSRVPAAGGDERRGPTVPRRERATRGRPLHDRHLRGSSARSASAAPAATTTSPAPAARRARRSPTDVALCLLPCPSDANCDDRDPLLACIAIERARSAAWSASAPPRAASPTSPARRRACAVRTRFCVR